MSNEQGAKKKLLGWITGALNKVESALDRVPDAPEAAPPAPAPARARETAPLEAPAPPAAEDPAAMSKKRLAMILAYMKDPQSDPVFQNKPKFYQILAEERAYQQQQITEHRRTLGAMPPPAEAMGLTPEEAAQDPVYDGLEERRAELAQKLKTAETRQAQIFTLMKKLTGVKGKTGGTGFIAPPPGMDR